MARARARSGLVGGDSSSATGGELDTAVAFDAQEVERQAPMRIGVMVKQPVALPASAGQQRGEYNGALAHEGMPLTASGMQLVGKAWRFQNKRDQVSVAKPTAMVALLASRAADSLDTDGASAAAKRVFDAGATEQTVEEFLRALAVAVRSA